MKPFSKRLAPWLRWLGVGMALACGSALAGQSCSVASGPQRAVLLELYTSEGCSSCPPADRWLSSLAEEAAAGRVVPLALHVDYWDYIGWRDPFADPRSAERQRDSVRKSGGRSVYTPQLLIDGQDRAAWYDRVSFTRAFAQSSARAALADITLDVKRAADALDVSAAVRLKPGAKAARPTLTFALTENALGSSVTAGENRGEKLKHDFVVRAWHGPLALAGGSTLSQRIALKPQWKTADLAVVVFVQDSATGEVLQAVRTTDCVRG